MKLLLPLDVAHPYQAALKQLERLVPLAGADVLLLYVAESISALQSILTSAGKVAPDMGDELKQRAKTVLDEVAGHLKERCLSVSQQVVQGSPAMQIEKLALSQSFDMIAMGATEHNNNAIYLLGSTAAHVVKHAPGTILILRENIKKHEGSLNVLIAVDGSPASLQAIKVVASQLIALAEKVAVTVLTVVSITGIWKFIAPVEFIASIEDNLNMAAETILAEAETILAEKAIVPCQMIIRSGDPANEIARAAKDINADLIVVGAQGRSAVEQFFLGSVSHKLSMHAPCSTVVVK